MLVRLFGSSNGLTIGFQWSDRWTVYYPSAEYPAACRGDEGGARIIKKIAEQYVERLRKDKYPIVKAFAFGSRVRGDAHSDSDLDIAIISPHFQDPIQSGAYLLGKTHELDRNEEGIYIEPHGFNPEDFVDENPLAWEVKTTGVPLPVNLPG